MSTATVPPTPPSQTTLTTVIPALQRELRTLLRAVISTPQHSAAVGHAIASSHRPPPSKRTPPGRAALATDEQRCLLRLDDYSGLSRSYALQLVLSQPDDKTASLPARLVRRAAKTAVVDLLLETPAERKLQVRVLVWRLASE